MARYRSGIVVFGMLLQLFMVAFAFAQDVSLNAETDRTTVKFGESLTLTITLSQALGTGAPTRITTPNVDSIPNFDIVGRRTAQNMTFINGVGNLQIQTVLELVPRAAGEFTIPAISIKLPDGRTATSKPIKIKVLPPSEEAPDAEDSAVNASEKPKVSTENTVWVLFKAFLILILVIVLIIGMPILLSWYLGKQAAHAPHHKEFADDSSARPKQGASTVEKEANTFDFEREVIALKRTLPETSLEFYRLYYDIFHKALVASNKKFSPVNTPDELRRIVESIVPPAAHERVRRLFAEWEAVMYARIPPARSFSEVDEDARMLLRAVSDK